MIDTLIGALRLSLDKCNTISNPNEYGYEINQVLNRFKTNLFKLIPDKSKHLYDAKEFIQIRLTFHWKTWSSKPGEANIKEHSPVLLHVNGFIPELGLRANRERTFIRTVDIGDVVDINKIANIIPDVSPEFTESNTIASSVIKHTLRGRDTCVYHESLGSFEGVRSFTMQISALVYSQADKDERSYVQESDRDKGNPRRTVFNCVNAKGVNSVGLADLATSTGKVSQPSA
jgi:hypothetical protein